MTEEKKIEPTVIRYCPIMDMDNVVNEKDSKLTSMPKACVTYRCQLWDMDKNECKMGARNGISFYEAQKLIEMLVKEIAASSNDLDRRLINIEEQISSPQSKKHLHAQCLFCQSKDTDACFHCPLVPMNYNPREDHAQNKEGPPGEKIDQGPAEEETK